ncbi:unnamed protein product [Closterium sp. NIES-54]
MAVQELRWLTYLLTDLGERPRSPPVLARFDNRRTANMDGRGQSSHAPRRRRSFDEILREQATTAPRIASAAVAGSDGGLRRRQIGRQSQQTSQQPSQQQRRQEQQQQQQRGADRKGGDKTDKGEKGENGGEKSGKFERSESRRGGRWGCIDSCCWTMGNAVFLWFLLMLAYHLMPRQQIQAIQDALVGLPEVEPPGARLAAEGVKAKHPVVFVPGIVTGVVAFNMWSRSPSCPFIFSEPLPPFSPPPPPPFSSSPPSPPSLSLHALSLSSPSSRALRPFLLSPPPLTCSACVLTPSPPPHMLWGLHGPWLCATTLMLAGAPPLTSPQLFFSHRRPFPAPLSLPLLRSCFHPLFLPILPLPPPSPPSLSPLPLPPPSPPSLSPLLPLSPHSTTFRPSPPFPPSPPPLPSRAAVDRVWGTHPFIERAGAVGGAIMHGGPLQEEAGGRSEYFCDANITWRQKKLLPPLPSLAPLPLRPPPPRRAGAVGKAAVSGWP